MFNKKGEILLVIATAIITMLITVFTLRPSRKVTPYPISKFAIQGLLPDKMDLILFDDGFVGNRYEIKSEVNKRIVCVKGKM